MNSFVLTRARGFAHAEKTTSTNGNAGPRKHSGIFVFSVQCFGLLTRHQGYGTTPVFRIGKLRFTSRDKGMVRHVANKGGRLVAVVAAGACRLFQGGGFGFDEFDLGATAMKIPSDLGTTPESNTSKSTKAPRFAWFAERLNQAFDALGIPPLHRPGHVAEACKVTLPTGMRYLAGHSMPQRPSRLIRLAECLGVVPVFLAEEDEKLTIKQASYLHMLQQASLEDRRQMARFLFAYDNGSRWASAVAELQICLLERAAIYARGVERTLCGPIQGPAKVICFRGANAGGEHGD